MPLIAIIIGVVIAALDQLFKFLVTAHLKPVGTVNVLGDVFKLTYVENRGVAFGMFQGMQWIFVVLTVALLALLIIYMFKKRPKHKDYLSVSFFPPVCNFADYCITVGVVLLAIYLLFFTDAVKNNKKELKND